MGTLDNMLENQQQKKVESSNENMGGSSLLSKVSTTYKWLGFIMLALGVIGIISTFDGRAKIDDIIQIFACLGTGLFTLFAGCIGGAIDDIREKISHKG